MILLSAHKISKSFAHRTLFDGVSFGIEEKERIGFLGPNGAGKSTLLGILAGRIDADGGTVSRKKGLQIGFLEQTPLFAPDTTILQAILQKCSDPDDSMPRAMELIAKLSLSEFGIDHLVSKLSGGWQKRVAIGRELAFEPDLLFLDEPTNHLDLSSILWLEDYLRTAPFAIMMITHDRLFLQRVANRILDLDPRNPNYLLSVSGDYQQYVESKELELAALGRQEQVEKNRLRRETEWLHRGSIARQTKQSARIQAAGELKETVQDLKTKNRNRQVDLSFGEPERSPKKLIEVSQVSKRFGERTLFENVDLLVTPKTRLGLLGDNGCGKSTLIKVLLGVEPADSGRVFLADGAEVAYFEQSRQGLTPELSVLKNICPEGDYVVFQGQSLHVRSYLDRFFFSGVKAELPVHKLSGGEQSRLRLAQLMLKRSQILVLDEPTNDLDTDMLNSLESSLKDFPGAVILVSHDRYFLDAVSNQILAFPPAGSTSHSLEKFSSYFQWENWYRSFIAGQSASLRSEKAAAAASKKAKLSFKEKYELENMEGVVLKLEENLGTLQRQSEDQATLADHKALGEIHSRIASLQAEIDQRMQRWSELEAKVKS